MKLLEYLSVGMVLKPQGLKGEVKVEPLTDDMTRFDDLDVVYLKSGQNYSAVKIISRRYSSNFAYLILEGYEDRNQAEKLRGQYLWIPRHMARILPEDTFFIADLIGSAVITSEGRQLGQIERVIQTGSNDVYIVNGDKGEILIPALKKVVLQVDIANKRVEVDAEELEGLLPDED